MSDLLPAYLRLEVELKPAGSGRGAESGWAVSPARLRGGLGKALVDAFCPFGEPRCDLKGKGRSSPRPVPADLCRLATACPYGVLFAASLTRRPPFALYVPVTDGSSPTLTAEVTLYGPAWRHYSWVLAVWDAALRHLTPRGQPGPRRGAVRRIRPDRHAESLAGPALAGLPAELAPDLLGLAPEPFVAPGPWPSSS